MLFKYTGPEETVVKFGVTFTGHKPTEVTDPESIRRLLLNVEFKEVHALDHDGDGKKGGSLPAEKPPVRRGRPPKK